MKAIMLALVLLSSQATANDQALGSAQTHICDILEDIHDLLEGIASGIAAVMIVLMSLIWVMSADNTRARIAARNGVIHAVMGLVIMGMAITLVELVMENPSCISGW